MKDRVYFYNLKSDTLPIAEAGLGVHVHSSILHGIYDPSKANLPAGYDESDLASAFEKAVIEHGYRGYTNNHVTVVLNQKSVPTTYEGPRWALKKAA